jgi:hypothetical protein
VTDDALPALLRDAERARLRFVFADGEEMLAEVVSASHIDEDGTVVLLRVEAAAGECGWQIQLADIRSVTAPDGQLLYDRLGPIA